VKSDNTVACWGYNDYGQLGNGSMATATAPTPNGVTGATAVASGTSYSCAILQDKTATCWGANYGGQLGNGDPAQVPNSQPSPVKVVALTNAKQISAGTSHTCAVDGDGKAWCWGSNFYGQLGNGSTTATSTPQPITSLSGVVQISAGNYFTCALLSTHQVSCWGVDDHGQLGNGTVSDTSTPNPTPNVIPNLNDAVYVWAGGENHACAIRQGGAIACWGDSDSDQLGVTGLSGAVTKPVQIVQPTTAVNVVTGSNTSCAITTDGRGYCWGNNMDYQIGDGTNVNRATPTQISNFP
jgi:alpha-tubulin suppressor-like RCC1 family protein